MLRVVTFVANASVREQAEMESLLTYLREKGYLPVIRSMLTGVLSLAKLPEPDEQLITKVITQTPYRFRRLEFGEILGDLFFTKEFVYLVNPLGEEAIQASVIGYRKQEEALQKFCADVEEGIKSRFDNRRLSETKFDWKMPKFSYPFIEFFDFFKKEAEHREDIKGAKPNYTSEDIKATELLVNTDVRRFMLRLAQVGKMTSKDAVDLARSNILERLLSLGLITEEYLLTCKQDQHTICVVPSKEHLAKDSMASLRCSLCGRSFPEENLQVIYTLTERGKKLLDSSLWMSIWVTEILKKAGVKKECIKWGLEARSDELDIVVEDFPSAANKSVRVKDNGTGGGMGLILDDPIEDKTVSLEFKWLLKESAGSDVEIFYVMNQQCPDDWSGVCIAMVPGKTSILEYHDNAWVQFGKIKPDVWHEFKIVMHLADNKYDFYYDDQQVVKNAAFRKYDGIKGIDKFNVANIGDGGTTFDTYFDDIMLYEGTKRPVSVDPMSSLPTEWGEIKKGA